MKILSNLFDKKETSVLGVDIGSSAIKIVQIKKKNNQAILETYGELALGPYAGLSIGQAVSLPPQKLAQALIDLMREKEVNVTTNKCGVSIPFSSSLMSLVEMPAVSNKQLQVMVPLEARKYIPVPISEVMLDWSVIPKSEVTPGGPETPAPVPNQGINAKEKQIEKIDVLIVAIHKQTIAQYQDIVSKSQLDPGFYEIEIFSTMRSVLGESLQPIMIVDMGAANTKVYIVERGLVRASHAINRGSQDITANIARSMGLTPARAEELKREAGLIGSDKNLTEVIKLSTDYIMAEARNTLLSFEKKYNRTVSKAVLVGGGSTLKGFREVAQDTFKTEVEAGNPFGKLSTPAFLENILKETGPEFSVAIGLALRRLAEDR